MSEKISKWPIYQELYRSFPESIYHCGEDPNAIQFLKSPTSAPSRNRLQYLSIRGGLTHKPEDHIKIANTTALDSLFFLALHGTFSIDELETLKPAALAIASFRITESSLRLDQFQGARFNEEYDPYYRSDGREAYHHLNFVHWPSLMTYVLSYYAKTSLPMISHIEIDEQADRKKSLGKAHFVEEVATMLGFEEQNGMYRKSIDSGNFLPI